MRLHSAFTVSLVLLVVLVTENEGGFLGKVWREIKRPFRKSKSCGPSKHEPLVPRTPPPAPVPVQPPVVTIPEKPAAVAPEKTPQSDPLPVSHDTGNDVKSPSSQKLPAPVEAMKPPVVNNEPKLPESVPEAVDTSPEPDHLVSTEAIVVNQPTNKQEKEPDLQATSDSLIPMETIVPKPPVADDESNQKTEAASPEPENLVPMETTVVIQQNKEKERESIEVFTDTKTNVPTSSQPSEYHEQTVTVANVKQDVCKQDDVCKVPQQEGDFKPVSITHSSVKNKTEPIAADEDQMVMGVHPLPALIDIGSA